LKNVAGRTANVQVVPAARNVLRTLQDSLRVIADSHFDSQLEESSPNGTSVAF
jgi:hypothetical protein